MDAEFKRWYRASKCYRPVWVPHGIDQLSILSALYRHRAYATGILLDIGCGGKQFAEVFKGKVTAYLGLDLPSAVLHRLHTVDIYGDACALPIKSESVTTVLATQVLGYVYEPEVMLREIHRVLTPGGRLILTYTQSGGQADPTDYYRFTPGYYRHAFQKVGLRIEVLEARTGTLGMIGEHFSGLIYYGHRESGFLFRLRRVACFAVQNVFSTLDRMFYEPHCGIGHLLVASKTCARLGPE